MALLVAHTTLFGISCIGSCISQRLSVSDDQVHINVNDTVEEEDTDVVLEEDTDTRSPLLQDKEHYKPDPDEPHNVEC